MAVSRLPSRRPTLRDVAGRAGVSFKTVSRVVNDEGGVSDDLVVRVEEAITALGYRPDDRARHLRSTGNRSRSIGFVMVDVANPFFSSILRGMEEVARQRGHLVLSGSTDGDLHRQDELVKAFVARRVDGLIVVPSGDSLGALEHELNRGTPLVFVDLDPPDATSIDLVRSDHHGGAIAATRHLLANGHRDIAFFGDDPSVFSASLRLAGFRDAMRSKRLKVSAERVVTGHHHPDAWRQIVTTALENGPLPTALFTAQNFVTVGAVQALHDLGLQHRIAHVGFDDVELADVVEPGITVVPQQPRELGRRAAEMLFRRLDGATNPPTQEIVGSSVIARGSGELRPS